MGVIAGAAGAAWMYLGPVLGSAAVKGHPPGGKKKPAAVVVVRPVTTARETIRIQVVGTARARRSATLHPAAAGEITRINFITDQHVTAGSILLELDREFEQLAVDLARIRLADAQRIFERLRRLKSTGAVANATFDDAQSALAAARIALKQAEVALADRHVVAPFSGRIGLTALDVGDRVDTGSAIASLDQRETLLVRFEVPEALLGRIVKGDKVQVTPWSDPNAVTEGVVFDVGSRINERTRGFPVRARIANPNDTLRPGMSFRVASEVTGPVYPMVPEIAVQWGGDGSFVWMAGAGKARWVKATIVQRQEAYILVDARLQAGDLVVVEGFHRLRDGKDVSFETVTDGQSSAPGQSRNKTGS
jgi:RND family efflux transporter MFP subunit